MQPGDLLLDYPRTWMFPFLVAYLHSGQLARTASFFDLSLASVIRAERGCPNFALALAAVKAELAERLWRGCKHRVPGVKGGRVCRR